METTVICPLPILAAVIPSVSTDKTRPVLTGVCLYTSSKSSMVLVAASTDSYRLTVAGVDVGNQSVETLIEKGKVDRNDPQRRIIIEGQVVKNILKAASKREHSQTTHVKIGVSPSRNVTWSLLIAADDAKGCYTVGEPGGYIEGEYPEMASLTGHKSTPTFGGFTSYWFNPTYLGTPHEISQSLKRYTDVQPYVGIHGSLDGNPMKPIMFTMHGRLKDNGLKVEAAISVFYLVMPVRCDLAHVAYPNAPKPTPTPVVAVPAIVDSKATYDYTVDTPCPPKRTAYTLDPEGDAAFATAWRKWMNHCDWIAEGVEPCKNDPRYGWWMEHVNTDVSGLDASDFYSTDDVEPGGVPVVAS